MIGSARGGFTNPSPQELQVTRMPAPIKGMDARAAVGAMQPENCIYAYNLVPAEYGLLIRDGYREWQTEVTTGAASFGIETMMPYDALNTGVAQDRLFAVTNQGIWNVTDFDAAPILMYQFIIDTTDDAGHGIHAHYIDQAGNELMFYADSANGLFTYTADTDTWVPTTGITGTDPSSGIADLDIANVVFVVVHKQRIWLIEDGASHAWYLPIASRSGACKPFFFGSKFPHGGKLLALINWSRDGGMGLDDYLVAVSSAGDLIPYQGSDPSQLEGGAGVTTAGWSARGTYFIGKIPLGRRFFSEYSGELYLLSTFGLISMNDLLKGVDPKDVSADSLTFPVSRILRTQLLSTINEPGWEPIFIPSQGVLLIASPESLSTGQYIQYSMNLTVQGWGLWRGVPMECLTEWNGKIYFGTEDDRICVMDVPRDEVLLDQNDPTSGGYPVNYSMLTAYTDGGQAGVFKRAQFVRPDFLSVNRPTFSTKILYDYDIQEITFPVTPPLQLGGAWDVGNWDNAVWGGGEVQGFSALQGNGGIGRYMAIAMRGECVEETRLISWDLMWVSGGPI